MGRLKEGLIPQLNNVGPYTYSLNKSVSEACVGQDWV